MRKRKYVSFPDRCKQTGYNILHANELASDVEFERKRANRNAALGVSGVIITGITGIYVNVKRRLKLTNDYEEKISNLKNDISILNDKISELEGEGKIND
jgi:hypothetical protein